MVDKKLCVVKTKDGYYWCGYNTWDKQLRKAKVYTSVKYAQETVDRFNKYEPYIVEVKMYETGEVITPRCPGYCGITCVNGSCPVANMEEYEERCYPLVHSCDECHWYRGCEDCCFDETDMCIKR